MIFSIEVRHCAHKIISRSWDQKILKDMYYKILSRFWTLLRSFGIVQELRSCG